MSPGLAKKGRGRPSKKTAIETSDGEEEELEDDEMDAIPVNRNKKVLKGDSENDEVLEDEVEEEEEEEVPPPKKGKGRAKATKITEEEDAEGGDEEDDVKEFISPNKSKGRGRPPGKKLKRDHSEGVEEEEAPIKKSGARAKVTKTVYKEDSGDEDEDAENDDGSEFDGAEEADDSEDDFDPKASKKKKKTPVKKKSAGKGRGRGKTGRGRPKKDPSAGPKVPKKKASSPIHYEYDLSDTSDETEVDSDDSKDSNFRPNGNNSKMRRKKITYNERGSSEDDCNWRPGKDFPGSKGGLYGYTKSKAKKVKTPGEGKNGEKKGRGRPPKADKEEKVGKQSKKHKDEEKEASDNPVEDAKDDTKEDIDE